MLYRSYQERLAKLARAFERVWRFRLLFLAGFALLLAAAATLLGVTGTVYGEEFASEVVYGQSLSPSASALFRTASFEYRAAGGEWTEEEPRLVGEYEVRAVGKSVAGTRYAGEAHSYRIVPRETEVRAAASSLVYGDELAFSASLCYGDTLTVSSYSARPLGGRLFVTPDGESISARSESGEDVSSCYLFVPVERTIEDVPRPVVFETPTLTFGYDGNVHTGGTVEVAEGNLLSGHTVEAVMPSLTSVGSVPNSVRELHIYDEAGEEVTEHYSIAFRAVGTLTVTPRALSVTTRSDSFVYDGTAHRYEDFSVAEGSLAEGETLRRLSAVSPTEAGEYPNYSSFAVYADGEDVTSNYALTASFGTVTVEKRILSVTTRSDSFVYDGTAHRYEDGAVSDGSLAEGQELRRLSAIFPTEAGEYRNYSSFAVYADGKEVTSNYVLSLFFGTVTVERIRLTVEAMSDSFLYDGAYHVYDTPSSVTRHEKDGTYHVYRSFEDAEGMLARGQTLVLSAVRVRDRGVHPNAPSAAVYAGETDVSANYEIELRAGELTVTPRPVSLLSASLKGIVYDGAPHAAEGYEEENLVAGHRVEATYRTFTEAGTHTNDFEKDPVILDGAGNDVTSNYEIDWKFGTVTIDRRPVTLVSDSERFVYDGIPHAVRNYSHMGEYDLVKGHFVSPEYPSYTEAGEHPNEFSTPLDVYDGERNVSSDYEIQWQFGTVTIDPRPIAFVTGTKEDFVYNGAANVWHTVGLAAGYTLAAGESFAVTVTKDVSVTGVCKGVRNELEFEWRVYRDGRETTSNYAQDETEYGTLGVLPRPVVLTSSSVTVVYDAAAHAAAGYEEDNLVAGHRVEADYRTFTEAGTHTNDFEKEPSILDGGGNDVTANYDITWEYGKVVIQRRKATVETGSGNTMYDGTSHTFGEFSVSVEGGALEGHTFEPVFHVFKDVCEQPNKPDAITVRGGEADVTANYDITWQCGTVTIAPRPVTVTAPSETRMYDGKAYPAGGESTVSYPEGGLGHDVSPEYRVTPEMANVGEHENEIQSVRITAEGEDVTGNYQITTVSGTLTVTARPVSLLSASLKGIIYDGEPHAAEGYTDTGMDPVTGETVQKLVEGHRVEATYRTFTEAGTHTNDFERDPVILDGTGNDVTSNYEIDWKFGTVSIDRRPVTLVSDSERFVYDGAPHDVRRYFHTGEYDLVEGHFVSPEYPSFTEAGEHPNEFPTPLDVYDGERNVSSNYEIQWQFGTVTIDPRPVVLLSDSLEGIVYDGIAHAAAGYEDTGMDPVTGEAVQKLVDGHYVEATYPSFTDVKEGYDKVDKATQAYENVPTNVVVRDKEGNDVTRNYQVEWQYGTVTIDPRPLHVETLSGEWVYDGKPHTMPEYVVTEEDLVAGQTFHKGEVTDAPSIAFFTQSGKENKFGIEFRIRNERDAEIPARNYELIWTYGTLTIEQRPIKVTSQSYTWVYDGTAHRPATEGEWTLEMASETTADRGFLGKKERARLSYQSFTDITDIWNAAKREYEVGTVENELTVLLYDDDYGGSLTGPKDTASNYLFECEWGKIRIKSPIVVDLFAIEAEYDGKEHALRADDYFIARKPPEVKSEWIRVELNVEHNEKLISVGGLTATEVSGASVCSVWDGENDLTGENRFVFVCSGGLGCAGGEGCNGAHCKGCEEKCVSLGGWEGCPNCYALKISPRRITLRTASIKRVKGSEPLLGSDPANRWWISYGNLVEGHEIRCTFTGRLELDEERALNTAEFSVWNGEEDVTACYEVTTILGELAWYGG